MRKVRIALTKGRLENRTVDVLEHLGYDVSMLRSKGRKLILEIPWRRNRSRTGKGRGCHYICRTRCL